MTTVLFGVLWNLCSSGTRRSGLNSSVDSVVFGGLLLMSRRSCIAIDTPWLERECGWERGRERERKLPVLRNAPNIFENHFLRAGTEQQIMPNNGSTPVSTNGSAALPAFVTSDECGSSNEGKKKVRKEGATGDVRVFTEVAHPGSPDDASQSGYAADGKDTNDNRLVAPVDLNG